MPKINQPKRGSLEFWPRSRALDIVARIRTWAPSKETKLIGFAAYKVGMTHVMATDNRTTSQTKGEDIQIPVTILECPPLKISSILLYKKDAYGLHASGQITADKLEKEATRKINAQKKPIKQPDTKNIAEVRIQAYTQPKLTSIGKKTPEFFELGIGGTKPEEKLAYAQGLLGKEIKITDVFGEGQLVDITSITKGKGVQGPVKRFGMDIRAHKSQKAKRGPGSLGPWHGPRTYRIGHAGQMGYQQRMDRNKQIMKIGDDVTKINAKGGFLRYGFIKNSYLLIKGSVGGPPKRLITLSIPRKIITKLPKEPPQIVYTSISSKQ